MVLATIIRLEMAYPGVGILAGDSLQYLSVVTAHAVIMVFFMIMPLLFGAFGNFLLPTQLGVHDVAFPRLNSAAFWFLPAGLLMLVQLVCLDRRYQRMNCYNIREIQSLLKSKYSPNTADNAAVRFTLDDTVLGLRYNSTGLDFLDSSVFMFYKNAVVNHPRYRAIHEFLHKPIVEFDSVKLFMGRVSFMFQVLRVMCEDETLDVGYMFVVPVSAAARLNVMPTPAVNFATLPTPFSSATSIQHGCSSLFWWVNDLFVETQNGIYFGWAEFFAQRSAVLSSPQPVIASIPSQIRVLLTSMWDVFLTSVAFDLVYWSPIVRSFPNFSAHLGPYSDAETLYPLSTVEGVYVGDAHDSQSAVDSSTLMLQEQSSDQRFVRFMNPIFRYDFKVGNYIPDDVKKMNPHMFSTIKDVTTGIRKTSWFTSGDFNRLFQSNVSSHMLYFSDYALSNTNKSVLTALSSELDGTFVPDSYHSVNVSFSGGFYNFFLLLNSSRGYSQSR